MHNEKMAVLGEVAGRVGHELRNPLGVISGAAYYLKLVQPDTNEKIKKYHAMIAQETLQAEKIITDLLDFARVSEMNPDELSVPELMQRVLGRFPAPASVQVLQKLPAGLPMIYGDARHIEQVLGNLVINAYQAMVEGGSLIISVQQSTPGAGHNTVCIQVKDTGIGIPPEDMPKIFEPLFTTKSSGIGLGLAVSKKLVEANGGTIKVESEVGKGSTFTVYLPIAIVAAG